MKIVLILVVFTIVGYTITSTWEDCNGIDIGTTPSGYDIVSNGKVVGQWKNNQDSAYVASQDEKFEFMYIRNNLINATTKSRENLMVASTSILCSRHINLQPIFRKNSEEMYELEFDYRCSTKLTGAITFEFTIETADKKCKLTFGWKKECKQYHRPMFAQNVEWVNHNTYDDIHSIYTNGIIENSVFEKSATQFDKMSIDNAIPIDFGKTVRISYYTKNDSNVKALFDQNKSQYKLPINKIYDNMNEFSIERPMLIYDKEVQDLKIQGNQFDNMKIGLDKKFITLDMKCLYYIPEESTTFSIVISIPGFDDYSIYFYGW